MGVLLGPCFKKKTLEMAIVCIGNPPESFAIHVSVLEKHGEDLSIHLSVTMQQNTYETYIYISASKTCW